MEIRYVDGFGIDAAVARQRRDQIQVTIGRLDARTIEPLLVLAKGMLPLALSPDGRHLAVSVDARRLKCGICPKYASNLHTFGLDWVD